MRKKHWIWLGMACAVLTFAACNDDGGSGGASSFGLKFGLLFRANPNSEPGAVNDGDAGSTSLTGEPTNNL